MKRTCATASIGLGLACVALLAQAQGNSAALSAPLPPTDPCRSEVSKFEETIALIRQTQGTPAATALKEKLLPAKLENELLFKEGYCGLARYLREKKLNR